MGNNTQNLKDLYQVYKTQTVKERVKTKIDNFISIFKALNKDEETSSEPELMQKINYK